MRKAKIVVGLGFGDEGKGSWVEHLVRRHGIKQVVRFNGGAQARHHIHREDGAVHGFAQFGCGAFSGDVATLLSRFMLIEPESMLREASELEALGVSAPLRSVLASEDAPIITPFNRLLNRIREVSRGASPHGSCGFGIGVTQGDVEELSEAALYLSDLSKPALLREKLHSLWELKLEAAESLRSAATEDLLRELESADLEYYEQLFQHFAARIAVLSEDEFLTRLRERDSVFEGAQGFLLDQQYGFFPHCTRSNTGFTNAETLLREAGFEGETERVGLLRAYGTRHGAGPFPTEDKSVGIELCDNDTNRWQGEFRQGWFDAVTARYALRVSGGVDTFALTNLDRLRGMESLKIGTSYTGLRDERFYAGRDLLQLEPDLALLAERSALLEGAAPEYSEHKGWSDDGDKAREDYLEAIEELCGRRVNAVSATARHHKIYRSA